MAGNDNLRNTVSSIISNIAPGIALGSCIGIGFGIAKVGVNYIWPIVHKHKLEIPSTTQESMKGIISSLPKGFEVQIPRSTQESMKGIISSIPKEFEVQIIDEDNSSTKKSFSFPFSKNTVSFPCNRINEAYKHCKSSESNAERRCNFYTDLIKDCRKMDGSAHKVLRALLLHDED